MKVNIEDIVKTLDLRGASAIILRRGSTIVCRDLASATWPEGTPKLPIFEIDDLDAIKSISEKEMLKHGWVRATT